MVTNLHINAGDIRDRASIPRLGRSPGVGSCNPLQYSCLENSMDTGAWRAPVGGITKSWTRLSNSTHTQTTEQKAERNTIYRKNVNQIEGSEKVRNKTLLGVFVT